MLQHSQERASSPFHNNIEFFCGTGLLPVPNIGARCEMNETKTPLLQTRPQSVMTVAPIIPQNAIVIET